MTAAPFIERAVRTLEEKLPRGKHRGGAGVPGVLMHLRSAFVAIVIFADRPCSSRSWSMFAQGISSNIMSLGRDRHRHRRHGGSPSSS